MHASNNPTTKHHLDTYGPVSDSSVTLTHKFKLMACTALVRALFTTILSPISQVANLMRVNGSISSIPLVQNTLYSSRWDNIQAYTWINPDVWPYISYKKHHDGYALFDTGDTTHRSTPYLGPGRDFLAELFNASKVEKPDMRRGAYYSMPEW